MLKSCILAVLLPLGCYTGIDGSDSAPGADDSGGPASGGDSGGSDGDDDGSSDDGGPPAQSDCHGFSSGLRRLNLREYEAALAAVLGDVDIGAGFPADGIASGFDTDAELLHVSDVWLAAHAAVAEEAVTAALAAGSPQRDHIFVCATEDTACAEEILSAFALDAWRRPIEQNELDSLLGLMTIAADEGDDFEVGISLGLQAIVLSPNFVYKVEEEREAGEVVDGYELATRLAFFLWSAPPDEELLAAAEDLSEEAVMLAQIDRMLADPKAAALTEGFAAQWLSLSELEAFNPVPTAFPGWDDGLREAMETETKASFDEALAGDLPVGELVASDEVYVNETLAAHYGISGVTGDEFRWVDGGGDRHGLLTQGAILTLTSHPNQSSPTRRGLWVTDRLLCSRPPPPPADVDNTLPDPADAEFETIREFLETVHLGNAACSSCHEFLDPVGFALENYDGIGEHRDEYDNGAAIDSSGRLSGENVTGPGELAAAVADSAELQACVASFAVGYATNRGLLGDDACIVDEAVGNETVGLRTLLEAIATHPSFAAAAAPLAE